MGGYRPRALQCAHNWDLYFTTSRRKIQNLGITHLQSDKPVILTGDFNMVEVLEDKYLKLRQLILGTKKKED